MIAIGSPDEVRSARTETRVFVNTTRERKRDDDDDDENGNGDSDVDDGRQLIPRSFRSEFRVLHTSGGSVPSPNRTAISTNRPAVLVR